jgi:hypothetical protein
MTMQSGITRIFSGMPSLNPALNPAGSFYPPSEIMSRPFSAATITICPLKKPSASSQRLDGQRVAAGQAVPDWAGSPL